MTDAYVSRAVAHARENNTAAALSDLNTAIGRTPDLERAYFYRGTLYLNTGNSGKAIADLMMAVQHPTDARALYARGLAKRK